MHVASLGSYKNVVLSSADMLGILLLHAIRIVAMSFCNAIFPLAVLMLYRSGQALSSRVVIAVVNAEIVLDSNSARFFCFFPNNQAPLEVVYACNFLRNVLGVFFAARKKCTKYTELLCGQYCSYCHQFDGPLNGNFRI